MHVAPSAEAESAGRSHAAKAGRARRRSGAPARRRCRFPPETHPLGQGRNQARRGLRAQKLLGVRIEGDGERRAPELCASGAAAKNLAVTEMHAVEIADGGHRGSKRGWDLVESAIDGEQERLGRRSGTIAADGAIPHSALIGLRVPSTRHKPCARASAQLRLVVSWPRSCAMFGFDAICRARCAPSTASLPARRFVGSECLSLRRSADRTSTSNAANS